MNTMVVFGIKYETKKIIPVETGFWWWKKRVQHTIDDIRIVAYQKALPVDFNSNELSLPVFGTTKIVERVSRTNHIEIWMGYHGYLHRNRKDLFIDEATFKDYEQAILADGYQKVR